MLEEAELRSQPATELSSIEAGATLQEGSGLSCEQGKERSCWKAWMEDQCSH